LTGGGRRVSLTRPAGQAKGAADRRIIPQGATESLVLGRLLCQLVKTMHSTFEGPQSLAEEIAMVYNMF
jgi:hypothetical protein